MLTLAIQSVKPVVEIVLFKEEKVIFEKAWLSNRDEISKLLPTVADAFEETQEAFSDLKKIVVVNGPGGFSATRIGVTLANTLSYALQTELYQLDVATYESLADDEKLMDENEQDLQENIDLKERISSDGKTGATTDFERIDAGEKTTLAKVCLKFMASNPQPVAQATPLYATEAKITPSKKPKFI